MRWRYVDDEELGDSEVWLIRTLHASDEEVNRGPLNYVMNELHHESHEKETPVRKSLIHGFLVIAAAATALSVPAAIPASAVSVPRFSSHETGSRPTTLTLSGGIRAVPAAERRNAVNDPALPCGGGREPVLPSYSTSRLGVTRYAAG